jgi:sporulation protein YlmC with PRC-barrel domain
MARNSDEQSLLNGATVIGGDGQKVGSVDAVYYDNGTDRPEWVAVRSGLLGSRVTLVPISRTDHVGDQVRIPFDKVQLRNAPHHDPSGDLSPAEEADLCRYYGIAYPDTDDASATTQEFTLGADVDREPVDPDYYRGL